jgi:hypothetical protein
VLTITIPEVELYDEVNNEFISIKEQKIQLEHSLISISKWEAKWKIPFLDSRQRSNESMIDYVRCMTVTPNVHPAAYNYIPKGEFDKVGNYIKDTMSATTLPEYRGKPNREIMTSELLYYYVIANGIPIECQKWHLNRLMTLIRIFDVKNTKGKKMPLKEVYQNNTALNEARRAMYNSKG